jgi:hypothetical protein
MTESIAESSSAPAVRFFAGRIAPDTAAAVCREYYGRMITVALPKRDERHNLETIVTDADGNAYLLQRLVDPVGSAAAHELWNRFAEACETMKPPLFVSNLIANRDGAYVSELPDGARYRLLEFRDGPIPGEVPLTAETAFALGALFGRSQRAGRTIPLSGLPVRDDDRESYCLPTPAHQWHKIFASLGLHDPGSMPADPAFALDRVRSRHFDHNAVGRTLDILASPDTLSALSGVRRPRPDLVGVSHGNARLASFVFSPGGQPIGLCNPDSV